jgi:hypothetical protein
LNIQQCGYKGKKKQRDGRERNEIEDKYEAKE